VEVEHTRNYKPVELPPELVSKFAMHPSEFSPLPVGIVEADTTDESFCP